MYSMLLSILSLVLVCSFLLWVSPFHFYCTSPALRLCLPFPQETVHVACFIPVFRWFFFMVIVPKSKIRWIVIYIQRIIFRVVFCVVIDIRWRWCRRPFNCRWTIQRGWRSTINNRVLIVVFILFFIHTYLRKMLSDSIPKSMITRSCVYLFHAASVTPWAGRLIFINK